MNKREESILVWQRLEGLSDEIRECANTWADPQTRKKYTPLPLKAVRYLEKHVQNKIWLNHLALMALYSAAQNCDEATIYSDIATLHSKLLVVFRSRLVKHRVKSMADFDVDKYLTYYLNGVVGKDTKLTRLYFFNRYQATAKRGRIWISSLPYNLRKIYQPYLFTPLNRLSLTYLLRTKEVNQHQQSTRKEETDALLPYYPDLRTQSHLRFNLISRLRQAFKEVITSQPSLPHTFTYQEGEILYRCRLWDYQTFGQHYRSELQSTLKKDLDKGGGVFKDNKHFLEILDVSNERTQRGEPLWFTDILKYELTRRNNYKKISKQGFEWLSSWGYAKTSFGISSGGFFTWQEDWLLIKIAKKVLPGMVLPIDDLYAVCAFGLLAVDLFTTTGARLTEVMQISLDRECLVRLLMPASPQAKNQSPRIRYILRLIPKGEKKGQRQDFFIGEETKKLLVKTGQMLGEHYLLQVGQSIPTVVFCFHSPHAHKFKPAPYLFQYRGKALNGSTISACLRFILHGIFLKTRNGRQFSIRPHLLRHAFATHAVNVEKISVDIVGKWLHQKDLRITEYYSRVTDSMAAEAADSFLLQIATSIDVTQAVMRSPEELQKLFEEAKNRAGTLTEVIGGVCVSHGYCSIKFECIGCPGKVPNPNQRQQIERRKAWALKEVTIAEKEGLYPEAQRLRKLVADAEAELKEIKMIEEYQKDETTTGKINFTQDY